MNREFMAESFVRNLLHILPFGFAYYRLLMNKHSEAEDYLFLEINPAFEKLTGLQRESVLGKRASEIFTNKKNGNFNWFSFYRDTVCSGETQETTQWIETMRRYYKVTVIPADRETFATIIEDISGEVAAMASTEQQKEENQAVLRDLEIIFNSTHDAVSLVEHKDGEFRYIRNNAAHQELTGFRDIRGKTPYELYGKDIGEKLQAHYEQCMHTGRQVTYEQAFSFVPGERVWLTGLTPVFDHGEIRYLVGSSKDITELKAAQGENEGLTRRLQSMFTQHTAIMLLIEPISGRIVDANPAACEFYGYSREELLTLQITDINMLPEKEVERRRLMAYAQEERYFIFPHRLKSGEIRLVDVYSCPIPDGENTLLYSIIFDVTDRETYRNGLFREKEMLRTTLQSIGDGVVTTNNDGVITSFNSVAQEITGWKNDEAEGRLFTEVFRLQSEETGKTVENPIEKVLATGRIVGLANHTVLLTRQGKLVPIADSAAPIRTRDGQIFGVVMVFRDVSKDKEQSDQIRFLSYHDSLTGLYNRRYIEENMKKLDTAENLPISVIMGDVNGLKITNDVFGHEAGDTLLRNVAETLEKNCRKDDLIARWGGDEFVIFMPGTSLTTAEEIIQRIKSNYDPLDGNTLHLSLSLGCAAKETMEKDIRTAMQEAEEYMYHQKLLDGKSYRNAIINTLLATLYEKSIETEEHAKRLETFCHAIGQKLQLSSKEMDELSLLAILHDIGKVGISQNILQKPARLTPAEWEEMKRHPEIGYRIAQTTPELAIVADYILSHHERWDGKGYPRGLKGEEIPLLCRILAVTDAYDAMTKDRVYRNAMSKAEAILELEQNAGTQFDPAIVSLFIETVKKDQE
jgi:diguanylate cyclase (GGDEF)-like protein/PAS domain S-box-containing protein